MQIAIFSDTHLAPGFPELDANLVAVRNWVAAKEIGHSVHLGDVSADGVEVPGQLAYAQVRLRDWPGRLHVLPGNHDVGDRPGADGLRAYTDLFGPGRWTFRVAGWTLIGLDAQLLGNGDPLEEAQDRWLQAQVVGLSGPVGLFLHKPLFRTAPDDGDAHHRYVPPSARAPLLRRLAATDLRFVATGHTHQTRRVHIDGIEHLWTPSVAFTLPDGMQETIGVKETAVMLLTLDGAGYRFERVVPPGMVAYDLSDHAELYPAHAAQIRAARHARP